MADKFTTDDFTPCDILENLNVHDKTCTVIGYVLMCPIRRKSQASSSYFSKIYIHNGSTKKIQVIAWGKEADLLENIIIEFQRISPKVEIRRHYNDGDYNFELVVKQWTKIKVLGNFTPNCLIATMKYVELKDLRTACGLIEVKGYVKTCFAKDEHNFKKFGVGAITDGFFKLEIHITEYKENDNNIRKGTYVIVKGIPQIAEPNKRLYLQINSMEDVKFIDDHRMCFLDTIKGYNRI